MGQAVKFLVIAAIASLISIGLTDIAQATPCCGGSDSWLWWRLEKGNVIDNGSWSIGYSKLAELNTHSNSGGLVTIVGLRNSETGWHAGDPVLPPRDPNQHYYIATNPGVGSLVAEEHVAGESWAFLIGDRLIYVDEPNSQPTGPLKISFEVGSSPKVWEASGIPGAWLYVTCSKNNAESQTGSTSFVLGVGTSGFSELSSEWLQGKVRVAQLGKVKLIVKDENPVGRWFLQQGLNKVEAVPMDHNLQDEVAVEYERAIELVGGLPAASALPSAGGPPTA